MLRIPGGASRGELKRGLFVAVVGPDGAGKSTLVESLSRRLGSTMQVERVYLGKGDVVSDLWGVLAKVKHRLGSGVGGGEGDVRREVKKLAREDRERRGYRRRLWELSRVASAVRQTRTARRMCRARERGQVIVADRFPHHEERFAGGPAIEVYDSDRGPAKRWTQILAWVERALLDRLTRRWAPDLILHLSLTPEEAWRRCPEHHLEDVRRKADALSRVRFRGAQMQVIDASQSAEEVARQASAALLTGLSEDA